MIKAIFFDYHGVLDLRTFKFGVAKMLAEESYDPKSGLTPEEHEEKIAEAQKGIRGAYVAGEIPAPAFWDELVLRGVKEDAVEKARTYILHIELDPKMWSMLPELKKKYYLGILSDCPQDKYELIMDNLDFSKDFDAWYFSCAEGKSKKDKEFFELMETGGKFKKEEILFIDDQQKNVDFAKSLGYDEILFQGPDEFKAELARREGI